MTLTEILEPSDRSLVEAVVNGNHGSFETLVKRHQNMVFRFLLHFTGERHDSEDLTQETFLNFYRRISLYNPERSLKTWLIAIAKNLAISNHRQRKAPPIDPDILEDVIKDVISGPEMEIMVRERIKDVQAALSELPEEMREVLIMRYMLDFPMKKIAETLNIPEGTAKSRAFQGRTALRDALLAMQNVENQLLK
jgi:RNA polymerase sigma-70 factor (ECF subfamily)